MDTLRSMRVFRAVVELDSFVRASERLDLSPAMVSKHVMHLERHLGARLLNRSSRHLSLTEIGKVYFEQCREMLDNLDEVEATVGRTTVVPRGMLRLSAPVWFANAIFTRTLVAYRERFPELSLPNTEWNSARICSLPLFPDMTHDDATRVITALHQLAGN